MKSQIASRKSRIAFTLIELLVVITIIVILLALLMPALDKAIYQAELATCGARLKAIANTVTVYAFDHNRHYPHRPAMRDKETEWLARQLTGFSDTGTIYDERPAFRGYTSLKVFVDPLSGDLDLESPQFTETTRQLVYASYNLWHGWQWQNQQGMFRIGDRFTMRDHRTNTIYRYDVLANDRDVMGATVLGTHPDHGGVMFQMSSQEDETNLLGNVSRNAMTRITGNGWLNNTTPDRGLIDMNASFADGSVERYNAVPRSGDPRMTKVHAGHQVGIMPPQDGQNGMALPRRH